MTDAPQDRQMTVNERIIATFAAQFVPPLAYGRTDRVNNVRYPDAWTCGFWDADAGMGVTAAAFEGQLHAFIEASGRGIAYGAGQIMARAMGRHHETSK